LSHDRENFLAFTQEAHEIAQTVKQSLEGCARDQGLLAKAVDAALNRQKDFDQRYRTQLLATAGDLISAYSGMQERRSKSLQLTDLAGSSTQKIAEAVGHSIVSLQAGDSTRQRLEHVCYGLELAGGEAPSVVPEQGETDAARSGLLFRLQGTQL